MVMHYPGGKGAAGAAQQIINQIPPHRVYVEPFVGGGAVFAAKAPEVLAEYTYAGSSFRERQRIKRKVQRWLGKLDALEPVERNALLEAMRTRYGAAG